MSRPTPSFCRSSARTETVRSLVPPMLSRPSDGDLPTGQGLEANGKPAADTIRDGQRPVTLARASEPLNRYLKLNVPRMAT